MHHDTCVVARQRRAISASDRTIKKGFQNPAFAALKIPPGIEKLLIINSNPAIRLI
jgi:hypothetical protein